MRFNSSSVNGVLLAGMEDPSGACRSSARSLVIHSRFKQNLMKDFRRSSFFSL